MKANKKHLINQIEKILAEGICDMEEIDITSEKQIKLIWPYFEYYENQNKELIEALVLAKETIRQHHGLGMSRNQEKTMWQIYNNNSPEMRKINEVIKTKINERDKII